MKTTASDVLIDSIHDWGEVRSLAVTLLRPAARPLFSDQVW